MWLILVVIALCIFLLDYLWKWNVNQKLSGISGPLSVPMIGSTWFFFSRNPEELLELSQELCEKYGRTIRSWIFHIPAIMTSDINYVQELLSHPVEIKKNRLYNLLSEWLGDGLLMSYGPKWLGRRRAITPTFHFKILEEFIKIFDRQSLILTTKLDKFADGKRSVDIHHHVALATLDVICETAMGVRIDAQTNENCEYVRLLMEMVKIILLRFVKLAYRSDLLFNILTPKLANRQRELQDALHAFTERIIEERRQEILETGLDRMEDQDSDFGIKRRMALLDVLLSTTIDGKPLSNADIREEVDTFMFEGHDTTKSAIGFTLYCISRDEEVQSKLYKEVKEVLGLDASKEISFKQLNDLKYTEKVIRESLRMYPPVPFIGRQIMKDFYIDGMCIPKGVSIMMALMTMQNDEKYFPEPYRFLPERPNNDNAFATVPFSAGPRNCIGQRFAMLEIKNVVARIVQAYELLPLGESIKPTVSIVLESKTGWQMGFRKRIL